MARLRLHAAHVLTTALAAIFLVLALSAATRVAYGEIRKVHGLVTLEGSPVKGAVVMVEDPRTLEIRSYITDGDGTYHFANLQSDFDYEMWAQYRHRKTGRKILSRFNSDREPTVDFKLD